MIISKLNVQETGNLSNLLYTGTYLSLGFFFGTFAIVVGRQILELDEFKYLKLSLFQKKSTLFRRIQDRAKPLVSKERQNITGRK